MRGSKWTPEMDDVLERYHDRSAKTIAEIVGRITGVEITRNGVIGRMGRLGIKLTSTKRGHPPSLLRGKKKQVTGFYPVATEPPPGDGKPVLFTARTRHQCSWPLWDDAAPVDDRECCGQPVAYERFQWCRDHKKTGTKGKW